MSLQVDLESVANNDQLWSAKVSYNGQPLNLSLYTITAYIKATRTTSDGSATTYTVLNSALTITEPLAGMFTWAVPRANVAAAANLWYRIDVQDSSAHIYTVVFGNMFLVSA